MKSLKMLALMLLLGIIAAASASAWQIQMPAPISVLEHDPIEATSGIEVPEGWTASHDWIVDRPAKGRQYDDGAVFAIWGPPGEYEIRHRVVLVNFEEQTVESKTEYVTLTIRPRAPPRPPGPDPTPDPTPSSELAQQVRSWAAALDQQTRTQTANKVKSITSQLADGTIPTIPRAIEQLREALPDQLRDKVFAEYNRRESTIRSSDNPRSEVVDFLTDVSSGLF